MINNDLAEYIRVLRLQNETNDNAKIKLTALNKWNSQEIDDALKLGDNNLLDPGNNVENKKEISLVPNPKSLISKIIFVYFCIFSIYYLFKFGAYIVQLFIVFGPNSGLMSPIFIKINPWVLITPIILAFLTIFIVYVTLKIRVFNKKSWTLGLITLTIIPILYFLTEMLIIYQYNRDASF